MDAIDTEVAQLIEAVVKDIATLYAMKKKLDSEEIGIIIMKYT